MPVGVQNLFLGYFGFPTSSYTYIAYCVPAWLVAGRMHKS